MSEAFGCKNVLIFWLKVSWYYFDMFRVGSKKRKIDGEDQTSLAECLLTSGVSDQKTTIIWNKARKALGAEEVTPAGLKRIQRERLAPAEACYVPRTVLAKPEKWSHLLAPDLPAVLRFMAQESPAWRRCLQEVVQRHCRQRASSCEGEESHSRLSFVSRILAVLPQ